MDLRVSAQDGLTDGCVAAQSSTPRWLLTEVHSCRYCSNLLANGLCNPTLPSIVPDPPQDTTHDHSPSQAPPSSSIAMGSSSPRSHHRLPLEQLGIRLSSSPHCTNCIPFRRYVLISSSIHSPYEYAQGSLFPYSSDVSSSTSDTHRRK